jgi:hypothetical protein
MSADTMEVVPGEFLIQDPWCVPRACSPVRLRRSTDGAVPRLSTSVSAYYDARFLNVVFSGADDHMLATLADHDAPLYQEDVVEVFLAPERLTEYFEIEVNPLGTTFDARIESPDGNRSTMRADVSWECEGLRAGVRRLVEAGGRVSLDTLIRIPFAGLGRTTPAGGETWRGNFFRIDRHPSENDEFSAWRPTMKAPPDFHVPSVFGTLVFQS